MEHLKCKRKKIIKNWDKGRIFQIKTFAAWLVSLAGIGRERMSRKVHKDKTNKSISEERRAALGNWALFCAALFFCHTFPRRLEYQTQLVDAQMSSTVTATQLPQV